MTSLSCSWEILHACNYRCPYCFFIHCWERSPEEINTRHARCSAQDWLRFWSRLHETSGSFKIEVVGGEPFLYPGFIPLIKTISQQHSLLIVTNLSVPIAEIAEQLDPKKVRLHSSFHPHFAEIGDFLDKNKALQAKGFRVTTTMVSYPPIFDQLPRFRDILESAGISCWVAPYQGTYEGRSYPESFTQEQKDWLYSTHGAESRTGFQHGVHSLRPMGKPCTAGQKYFRAYPDGWVHRCSAAKDTTCSQAIGNIKDPDFRLLSDPTPCPAMHCNSPMEYHKLVEVEKDDRWLSSW
ncbi:MAG: hypothetical protein WCU88_13420 [Elusimicrobiota bacterium]|jgi:MoaA/NifB/PqqE/SkfB family radical SAM enzyme